MAVYKYRLLRVKENSYKYNSKSMSSPEEVEKILREMEADKEIVESMYVFYLNTKNVVVGVEKVAQGGLNSAYISPSNVFRGAIVCGAIGIVVAHNHPSGDETPSNDDIEAARKLSEIGKLLQIKVYDFVVIGDGFSSLRRSGIVLD